MTARTVLLALLAAASCSGSASRAGSPPPPYTVAPAASTVSGPSHALEPAHPIPPNDPSTRVLVFGDFGERNEQQRAVASMMVEAHHRQPFDAAFSLGDNVYECGLDPTLPGASECRFEPDGNTVAQRYEAPRDPRFEERFERRLMRLVTDAHPIVVHGVLGNHDVAGGVACREGGFERVQIMRTRACLQVAQRSPVWRMPGRHYFVDQGPARFVVIDTNLLIKDYGDFSIDDEVAFVREAVRGAEGRRVFVMAHHPAATAGVHRDEFGPDYLERLRRILEAGGGKVSAWFAGHDHVLQHMRTPAGLDAFVSGNGARARPDERFEHVAPPGSSLLFGSTAWGFAVIEVRRSGWSVSFETEGGKALHCCQAEGAGSCEPVACPLPRAPPRGSVPTPDLP